MPIWDEEWCWLLDDSGLVRAPSGRVLATFDVPVTEDDPRFQEQAELADRRAKLAAAAPAMVRLLLALEWAGHDPYADDHACPSCEWPQGRTKEHHPECTWLAVMRAAGVRE